jgi:serine/threonine-protein kinase
MLGRVLGERYRLVARIGAGGMGTVYRAEHVVLKKRMAVKILRHDLSRDEDLVRRFQQEAIAASAIGQENIVAVTDFGRTPDGSVYFVMEELDGPNLAGLLADTGPLPVERAVQLLAQVCRALAAAHANGIVHRDLKPDNVIVVRREDGTDFVKVVDFGVSKTRGDDGAQRVTRAGTIIGTPEYMAPEQGAAATVDHRADIYAFGVLAYELVTGTLPFRGETAIATLIAHQTKAVEPPSRRRPGLPPALEALILRALEKRAEARHQSMAEVAADLTRVLAGFGLPPVYERAPAPPPTRGPLGGLTDVFAAVPGPGPRRAPPRRPPSPDRGATVALDAPAVDAVARRRGGTVVAAAVTAAAIVAVVAAAAVVRQRAVEGRGPAAANATPTATPTATATATPTPTLPANPTANPTATAANAPLPSSLPPPSGERGPTSAASATPTPSAPAQRVASADAPRTQRVSAAAVRPRPPAPTSAQKSADGPRGPLGGSPQTRENPYRPLDDLKPDPF